MAKPNKPNPEFPLYAHASKRWAKKIKGKTYYYGPWNDLEGAFANYLKLLSGRQGSPGSFEQASNKPTSKSKTPSVPVRTKPAKPYPDYPLSAATNGQWKKTVRGRTHYFGPWADPDAALDKWLKEKDELLAGRVPRTDGGELTIWVLVNRFLAFAKGKMKNGELKPRTREDYHVVCEKIIEVFGRGRLVSDLHPSDFARLRKEFAKTHGPKSLMNDITRSRVCFNFAYKNRLVDKPVLYGTEYSKPSQAIMRKERHKKCRLFKAKELRALIESAPLQLKAMLLLAINAGLGNQDCATLPLSAIQKKWLVFPRPKTGIERKAALWPETLAALQAVAQRPEPRDKTHAD